MAKRITFDSEIIETFYTSLRQITIDYLEEFGRMPTRIRIDDVDYLVENNTRDDFSNWEKLNSRELSHYWNGYSITEETESNPS